VNALADILKIDPNRIKVISSEKFVGETYTNPNFRNMPYY
jgi:hypothetical protein